jgi:hypothetical protein
MVDIVYIKIPQTNPYWSEYGGSFWGDPILGIVADPYNSGYETVIIPEPRTTYEVTNETHNYKEFEVGQYKMGVDQNVGAGDTFTLHCDETVSTTIGEWIPLQGKPHHQ